jgi:hypothetical protein
MQGWLWWAHTLKCVHFGTLPNRRPSMNRPRRTTEIPEEPSKVASG